MRDDATELDHVPGDTGPPIINNTFAYLKDPWGFDDAEFERFGPFRRTRFFGRTIIRAGSVELAEELLVDRERCFSNKHGWSHFLGELFPGGLMLRDFDEHQLHRKILRAAFSREARQSYHASVNGAFGEALDRWAAAGTIAFYPELKRALFEQAAEVFLGLSPGDQTGWLLSRFKRLILASAAVVRRPLPGTTWRRGLKARRELMSFLRGEIAQRRAGEGTDLFSRLCKAKDEDTGATLDDDEIVDHLIFMVFAAHDTTASGLTATLDELSAAPELLARVCAECRALEPGLDDGGLGWDQLGAVPEIERAFREGLRLHPPVPYVLRRTVRATQLAGLALPVRTPTTVIVRDVHNDPTLWTEPRRFDPDRFAPERAEDRRHRLAWIPFGAGAHRCIGADLAMQQAKVLLFMLLRRFELERVSPPPTKWKRVPLPRPVDGLPLRLIPLPDGARAAAG